MPRAWVALFWLTGAFAQAPVTMKELMLDKIHPAANNILLFVNRGAPKTDRDWAALRDAARNLTESGELLQQRGPRDGEWAKDARALADVGAAAGKAAEKKNLPALAALTDSLDASCTNCHKQFRPNVFPREGAQK